MESTLSEYQDEDSPIRTFEDLKEVRKKINKYIELGNQVELKGSVPDAVKNYAESLRLIDEVLVVSCDELYSCTEYQVNQAREIQLNLSWTKQDVSMRLESLHSDDQSKSKIDQPNQSPPSQSQSNVQSLDHEETNASRTAQATEIFTIPNAVRVFHISAEGVVISSNETFTLHVVKFRHGYRKLSVAAFVAPAFLQVEDWIYPLMPGLSPALITKYRAYIFPDVLSEKEDTAVALILTRSVPEIVRKQFEDLLYYYTVSESEHAHKVYMQQMVSNNDLDQLRSTESNLGLASMISFLITAAASITAWIITMSAFCLVWLLQTGFRYLRAQISSAEEPYKIDPKVRAGVTYIKSATDATVTVTQYIVDKIGEGTMILAVNLVPLIEEHGKNALPESMKQPNNRFVKGTTKIVATSFKGMSTVYNSLDHASKSLCQNLEEESLLLIKQRFGDEAESFAYDTLNSAQNLFNTQNLIFSALSRRNSNLLKFAERIDKLQKKDACNDHITNEDLSMSVANNSTLANFMKSNFSADETTQKYFQILDKIGAKRFSYAHKGSETSMDSGVYSVSSIEGVVKVKAARIDKWFPYRNSIRNASVSDIKYTNKEYQDLVAFSSNKNRRRQSSVISSNDRNKIATAFYKKVAQDRIKKLRAEQKDKEDSERLDKEEIASRDDAKSSKKLSDGVQKRKKTLTFDDDTMKKSVYSGTKRKSENYGKAKIPLRETQ